MIGAYVDHLLQDGGITKKDDLALGTVVGYISSATEYLRHYYNLSHGCLSDGSLAQSKYVAALLDQRRTWKKPKDQKEPLSSEILSTMHVLAREHEFVSPTSGFLGFDSCLFDCIRLAMFTGSRLGEYGQSNVTAQDGADGFDAIPDSSHVPPEFRGKPLAFIWPDFEFQDASHHILDVHTVLRSPALARRVRIRFRYDKSPNNFVFRIFKRTDHFLCPVDAALSLVRRAKRLHRDFMSANEPLAMFRGSNNRRYTVRGPHMRAFMRRACRIAHPDPKHHLRRYIHCLTSHCCRVTAAVALFNAGISIDVISFRLRWNSDAVRIYLRDCYRSIGSLTSNALVGAYGDLHPSEITYTDV